MGRRSDQTEEKDFALRLGRTEFIVVIAFLLFSLRVVGWFQYPYILSSGDLRAPFVNEAIVKRFLYLLDEIDFGFPSAYQIRSLNPLFSFNILLQAFGMDLFFSQIITVFLVYFSASILMYILVKQLINGDVIAAFIASLYLSSNVYLVNDREISAIYFMISALLILPSLITFVRGIKINSSKLMALSGLLCILSYADFPNYRLALICLLMIFFLLIFLLVEKGSLVARSLAKLLAVFIVAYALIFMLIFTLVYLNFNVFMKTYAELPPLGYMPKISDVMRLTVMWTFYSSSFGKWLLPYGETYLNNPLIILLCYLPALLAFLSLILSKEKVTLYFSILALISILLTSGLGFIRGGPDIYALLMNFPLLKAFRGSHNWFFFLVFSFSILLGCTVSSLCRRLKRRFSRLIVIGFVIAVFLSSTYPLVTGDIARNWLEPRIRGTLLSRSYYELNSLLPNDYWSLLLPQRGVYIAYNFSGVPFQVGNPYPLIFSKPVISGVGTEYIRSESYGLIEEVYRRVQGGVIREETSKFLGMLGIKYLVLEKCFIFGNRVSAEDLNTILRRSECLRLVREWGEVDLFENMYALQKVYLADRVFICENVSGMLNVIQGLEWEVLSRSAFICSSSATKLSNKTLLFPLEFSWREFSPVKYEVTVRSNGPFLLVLLESYSEWWGVYVNGVRVPETSRMRVNMFANGWLIDAEGDLNIIVKYEAQEIFEKLVVVSLVSQVLLFMLLCRKNLVAIMLRVAHFMRRFVARFSSPLAVINPLMSYVWGDAIYSNSLLYIGSEPYCFMIFSTASL